MRINLDKVRGAIQGKDRIRGNDLMKFVDELEKELNAMLQSIILKNKELETRLRDDISKYNRGV